MLGIFNGSYFKSCCIEYVSANVWLCGVTLYVVLVGAYPFEDPDEPKDFWKTIKVETHLNIFADFL